MTVLGELAMGANGPVPGQVVGMDTGSFCLAAVGAAVLLRACADPLDNPPMII